MSSSHEPSSGGLFKSIQAKLGIHQSSGNNNRYGRDARGGDAEPSRASTSSTPGGDRSVSRTANCASAGADTGGSAGAGENSNAKNVNHPPSLPDDGLRPAAAARREGHPVSYDGYNQPLNTLPPVVQGEVFVKKLELCSVVYDFTDVTKQVREKEVKREALQDLVDYVNMGSGKFTEEASPAVVRMISQNLFRELPPRRHGDMGGATEGTEVDEEEPQLEPAWTHLSLVYELLLRYIVSSDTDAKVAKQYVNHQFIVRFLNLFDSEDPRERDYLKTILHRVYGKFMVHRPFIRKSINHVFYRFVYETERHNGIAELLEILGSIINGFALPLKEEHKLFLQRALIPLHKPKSLPMYHQQLAYCVTQFVEKDCTLASVVIRGLLRYWPVTNSHKEVLFLGELEEILELTHDAEFAMVAEPLLKQLSRCLTSNHFQVGERSLFLWNNEYIVQLLHHNKSIVVPLVVGALEVRFEAIILALSLCRFAHAHAPVWLTCSHSSIIIIIPRRSQQNATDHWNVAVQNLSGNVRKMFQRFVIRGVFVCRRLVVSRFVARRPLTRDVSPSDYLAAWTTSSITTVGIGTMRKSWSAGKPRSSVERCMSTWMVSAGKRGSRHRAMAMATRKYDPV